MIPDTEPTVVEIEKIEATTQVDRPPPPPRPAPPISVPDEAVLENDALDIDAEIDLDGIAEPSLPPPPDPYVEEVEEPEVFVVVEEMPVLIGGMEELRKLVEYPEIAAKAGIEGLVIVQFVVEKDGQPSNITVSKSAAALLDEAAVRAVRQLEFIP
ncbi:MAG: energy transducer TonB, partial [Candidatus Latescibacterota bacterium]